MRTHTEFRRDKGAPTTWYNLRPHGDHSPSRLLDASDGQIPANQLLEATPGCALALWTLDCNMTDVDCSPLYQDLNVVDERSLHHLPYLHPEHNQHYVQDIRLRVYTALGDDAPATLAP